MALKRDDHFDEFFVPSKINSDTQWGWTYNGETKWCRMEKDLDLYHIYCDAKEEPIATYRAKDLLGMSRSQIESYLTEQTALNEAYVRKQRGKSKIAAQSRELARMDAEESKARVSAAQAKAEAAKKAIELSRASAGTDLEVRPDVPYTPFKNYVRPPASPNAIVEVPFETETGIVMPPLPEHHCELPNAVELENERGWNSFESKKGKHVVVIPDGTNYLCVCGQAWYVRVVKTPFYAAKIEDQHSFGWHKIRWYHFGRKADLKRRQEKR